MQQQDHLGLWIGLVALLSLLTIIILIWAVTSLFGSHEMQVKVVVTETPILKPVSTATPVPFSAPTQVLTATLPSRPSPLPSASPTRCRNNAVLLRQVTSPEGSSLQPNQRFNQTWHVQNTGTCAWNNKYQLVHIQNERLSTVGAATVLSNVVPGQSVDLLVAMIAPANPGQYISQWQLHDDLGAPFGPALSVGVRVNLPTPTACVAQIGSFTTDRATLNRGESTTLRWSAVANAQRVEIDNGIGVVTAPETRVVTPAQTTTYTLAATCGGNRVSKTVTITVTQSGQPTSTSVPLRRDIMGIWANDKYTVQIMDLTNCTTSECQVHGEYAEWGSGPPVPGLITGTFNVDTGKIVLNVAMQGSAKSFEGKVDASNKIMSGQLAGAGTITLIRQQ